MMKIYVACLASYNNGVLHGSWFDLEDYMDAEELHEVVRQEVLTTSPFPNVEVECPRCGGDGLMLQDPGATCIQCKGSGEVPSAEEWAIHDHEGFPDDAVGEYTSFSRLYEIKELCEEAEDTLGSDYKEIVEAFTFCFGGGDMSSVSQIQDAYVGEYSNSEDFCQERWIDYGKIDGDSDLFPYIDWDHVWEGDMQHSYTEHNGHYFRSDW